MIDDQRHIAHYKKILDELFLPMVIDDYGSGSQDALFLLTDTLSNIYKHLSFVSFKQVTVYCTVNRKSIIASKSGSSPQVIRSYENLSQINGSELVIEVMPNGDLNYLVNTSFNPDDYRHEAIIYQRDQASTDETIFGKSKSKVLPPIPDADSYFAVPTYKTLELAFEDYRTKIARYSECPHLQGAWFSLNNIQFKAKPERKLRDSLHQFLISLRNAEPRPEQVVDRSHPVDIKVSFKYAPHLALIEIKWLGISLSKKRKVTGRYTGKNGIKRINSGAKQLAEYMDSNRTMAATHTSKGYLVIFDARRENCNEKSTSLSRTDGLKFENATVTLTPDYHAIRTDFAQPVRFFMEPKNMTP
jgi:hypothetical protein